MKKIFLIVVTATGTIFFSCKKEYSCEGCNGNKPPIAIAGPNQLIPLPTDSISLDGSASNDPDGTISEWLWKKISGPASSDIRNSAIAKTVVKNLVKGVYQFELIVTDDKGASTNDTMMVTVDVAAPTNHAPVANAGNDTTITSPANTANLDGSKSTDPDNNITIYQWTKINGPSSFNIGNANEVTTQVSNLLEGVYQFELTVTDAGGLFDKDTVQVTVNPQPSTPPPCTTNCGKIVFVSDRDGNNDIYTCNADGSNVTRLTNDAASDGDPAWSPDGTHIAFIKNWNSYTGGTLCIMNADGSNVVQTTFSNYAMNPAWSPDGTRIAFTRTYGNDWYPVIMVMDLNNGTVSALPNTLADNVYPTPAWSPDGTKIAFNRDWWPGAVDESSIFTISPQGSGFTTLTPQLPNGSNYWQPSWSPGGMKLSVTFYQSYDPNHEMSIAVMNADGTGLILIYTGTAGLYDNYTRTSWSPDGTRIAYTESKTIKWVAANGSASGVIIPNAWDADWKH